MRSPTRACCGTGEDRPDQAHRDEVRREGAIGARTGLSEFGVRPDAHVIDPDYIDERPDIPRILELRIGKMCPDTDQSPGIGDHSGLFLTDESWAHHLRHGRIAPQLRIKARVGDDDWPGGDLERGSRRLDIGMGKVD